MAKAGAKKAAPIAGKKQHTLFAKLGNEEQIVGSFDHDADEVHVNAAKLRFINQSHAEGRDANSITFRLSPNDEE